MTKLVNSAEGGTNTTTVTSVNSGSTSGNAFDVVTIGSGAGLTFDNTHVAHGSLAYKFVAGASGSVVCAWSTALTGSSLTQVWFRAYVYVTSHSVTLKLFEALTTSTQRAAVSINTSGKIILLNAAGSTISTSSTTIPANQWVRLEGFFIGSATVGQIECKIFTTSVDSTTADETLTTAASQNTGGTINKIQFGNPSTGSFTHWMDELGASDTAYLGPVKTGAIAVTLKKMVVAGIGHVKPVGTGTIKLKKIKVSIASHEKTVATGAIKLKKMKLSSSFFGFGTTRKISWDAGTRTYYQGVSNAVLYTKNPPGVPWNGLISVTQKGDAKPTSLYVDGQLYLNRNVPDAFAGTISAYTYPDELEPYIGVVNGITAQVKKTVGLTYQNNNELHLVYNVLLGPSNDDNQSLSASVNPVAFSWAFTTLPVNIPGGRPGAHVVIDLATANPEALSSLQAMLYGDNANAPSLPSIQAIIDLFAAYALLIIIDNGDGTWTAIDGDYIDGGTPDSIVTGDFEGGSPSSVYDSDEFISGGTPDDAFSDGTIITMLDSDTFQITWPSAHYIDADTYSIYTF